MLTITLFTYSEDVLDELYRLESFTQHNILKQNMLLNICIIKQNNTCLITHMPTSCEWRSVEMTLNHDQTHQLIIQYKFIYTCKCKPVTYRNILLWQKNIYFTWILIYKWYCGLRKYKHVYVYNVNFEYKHYGDWPGKVLPP